MKENLNLVLKPEVERKAPQFISADDAPVLSIYNLLVGGTASYVGMLILGNEENRLGSGITLIRRRRRVKRNEFKKKVKRDGDMQFWKDGREQLFKYVEEGLACWGSSDLRWFNFEGFESQEDCLELDSSGKIIGDE